MLVWTLCWGDTTTACLSHTSKIYPSAVYFTSPPPPPPHTHTTHSDFPWYKVFYRSLDKISVLRLDHQDELVEPFLAGLRKHPIPSLGMDTVLSVVPEGIETGQVQALVLADLIIILFQVYTFPLPNPKKLPEIPTDVSHSLQSWCTCTLTVPFAIV